MTAADESRVVWRHEADDDLRRALDGPLYHVWDRVASLRLTGEWSARKKQVLGIIEEERAALAARSEQEETLNVLRAAMPDDFAARSEPRAEGLRDVQERNFVAWLLDNGLKGDRYGAALQRLQLFRAGALEDAATPPAEGLDVERLARAIERSEAARGLSPHIVPGGVAQVYIDSATAIAREYAALAPEQPE